MYFVEQLIGFLVVEFEIIEQFLQLVVVGFLICGYQLFFQCVVFVGCWGVQNDVGDLFQVVVVEQWYDEVEFLFFFYFVGGDGCFELCKLEVGILLLKLW